MQRTFILALFAIVATGLLFAEQASAQSLPRVEISNDSWEKRKVCFYKDGTGLVPYRCFEMLHGEKTVWNRESDTAPFNVKVFRPGLVDTLLHYRRLPGLTNSIVLGTGKRLGYTEVARYRLKVCNTQFNQKIFFALHFVTDRNFLTEGWWSVAKGKCVEFAVSDQLRQRLNLAYGTMPRIYMYAETFTRDKLYWTGGRDGLMRCVDRSEEFRFVYPGAWSGNVPASTCSSNQKVVSFRPIASPKANEVYFYLTF
jgi:uncharacterized membrane protein